MTEDTMILSRVVQRAQDFIRHKFSIVALPMSINTVTTQYVLNQHGEWLSKSPELRYNTVYAMIHYVVDIASVIACHGDEWQGEHAGLYNDPFVGAHLLMGLDDRWKAIRMAVVNELLRTISLRTSGGQFHFDFDG